MVALQYNTSIAAERITKELHLSVEELTKATKFTRSEVARRGGVYGRKRIRELLPGLPSRRATKRVLYDRNNGAIWFGGNSIVAAPPLEKVKFGERPESIKKRRKGKRKKQKGRGGRPVFIDGRPVPRGFVWLKKDVKQRATFAYDKLPFQRESKHSVSVIRLDIEAEMEQTYLDTQEYVEGIIDEVMLHKARQIVRSRKI